MQDTTGLVARGEYIVRNVAVCGHCHAADPQKNPDGPLSGGLAFRNWRIGTVRASNLTPDNETGLGLWSEAEIVRAIRNGEDREGHLIAPVMPYEWFHEMSDRDALAVARYLKAQPPVRNEVDNDHSFLYALAKTFVLRVKSGAHGPAPARGPTPQYGQYLANHVALCADCHTPRGGLQAKPQKDKLFAGDATPPDGFPANPANLTPDEETGIGKWSEADFLRTIHTGKDPEGHELNRFMPYEQFRRMADDDLRAIYRYLRAVPAIKNDVPHKEQQH
jgi:mono/diheme cytochrome c family protein